MEDRIPLLTKVKSSYGRGTIISSEATEHGMLYKVAYSWPHAPYRYQFISEFSLISS